MSECERNDEDVFGGYISCFACLPQQAKQGLSLPEAIQGQGYYAAILPDKTTDSAAKQSRVGSRCPRVFILQSSFRLPETEPLHRVGINAPPYSKAKAA